jgi:hypothetical protein
MERILGDDLAKRVPAGHPIPTPTNALTSADSRPATSELMPDVLRDEEVVGSNPATPTEDMQVSGLVVDRDSWAVDRL